MKRIGYYPGCSIPGTAREYDESLRALMPKIGVELVEIPDWNCCGATAAHNLNHELSLALPARILALAEKAGLHEILVPCAACYNRLVMTVHELADDVDLRNAVVENIGMPYAGQVRPINLLEMFVEVKDAIVQNVVLPFDYPVACYYGCLLVRPPKILRFDRAEDPLIMDEIMAGIGAKPIDWAFKTECCGAGFSVSRTDIVGKLSAKIMMDAHKRGAEAVIVACPMCHANLDMRRKDIEKYAKTRITMPVMYLSQAVGRALGIKDKELGFHRHLVPVKFSSMKQIPAAEPKAAAGSKGA